ncbi:MAG: zinc-dependent metalloprotease [Flavobacteriaceae bacterium]|nr:zinc-dependent metalloprotease [Flavobacteriaceae bacterium]
MKKILLLAFFLPFMLLAQENKIGKVSQSINAAKSISGEFEPFEIFNSAIKSATENYSAAVEDGVIVAIDQTKINEIRNQDPKQMQLSIPLKSDGETVALDLIQVAVFSPDFKAITNNGVDITNEVDFGKHYRGIIAGNPNSLVSISVFESQISGFISNEEGNYTIGKLEDSDKNHIIYKDNDLKNDTQDIFCSTEDDGIAYTEEELSPPPISEQEPGDEIDVYIESGQSVYNAFQGNLTNTIVFITGIFTQSYVLYANDGISVRTSSMMVWVTPDPFSGGDSLSQLNAFTANVNSNQQNLNGDIAHLIERQNFGGIAWLNGMCSNNNVCYSGLANNSVITVPTYSWNVMVITHEMGHLMGSNHTHACVWNGNNTAIDGCAATEGSCARPQNPPNGGTIMSYCHLQGVGINFNTGFGPQPTAVILNKIANAGSCLDPEEIDNPPVAVCKSSHVVELDSNGEASITVEDIDGGSFDNEEIVEMSIDIDTFDCEDVGLNNVTLTVTDNDGLTSTCVGYVQVLDGSTMVTTCPEDITVSIPDGTTYTLLDYRDELIITTDICNVTPAATSQSPLPGTQLPVGVHVITVNALLDDGSIVTCPFEITIDNNLGLTDNSILSSLLLYPNPASEIVRLGNPQNLDLEFISIYDMTGRLIKTIDLEGMVIEQLINVSELSEANYFVIIQGEQTKIVKQLIIK